MRNVMKKIFGLMVFLLLILGITACNKNGEDPNPNPTPNPGENSAEETNEDVGFIIHFNLDTKENDNYKYNIWIWEVGFEGKDYQFNGEDDFGAYAKYKFEDFSPNILTNGIGFIIKQNKPWDENPAKDYESDRFIYFNNLEKDKYGYYNVWIMTQDKNIYTSPDLEISDQIQYFSFSYNEKTELLLIWFQLNKDFSEFEIKHGEETLVSDKTLDSDPNVYQKSTKKVAYELKEFPDIKKSFTLKVTFAETGNVLEGNVNNGVLYKTKAFNDLYAYDGELGAIYSQNATTFRVWSPVSTSIKLRVYENGTPTSVSKTKGSDEFVEYAMTAAAKGVFEISVPGDLAGKYYTYVVSNENYSEYEIVDPYAKSTGINGLRGMIVDFAKTNPDGWENVNIHNYDSTSLTVYETHIADLTSSATWGGTAANAKKFKGFYETGTKYQEGNVTVTTGFDHIKELGVNAVQILPFFDSYNDEENVEFNWGYNPLNYNALDGSFSSNPYDGYAKIIEFKELIKAYNEAGINIIMDVVYNHVNGLEKSNFDVLMPNYYFRYSNGVPSNGSGCGNETASELYMFRKFMIDSTEFWASEYKIGGYRFDLMGVHDVETMNLLTANLHTNVNEYITVYGEPWAGGTIGLSNGTPANQANMNKFEGYGCFNDKMRDALIKGGLSAATEKGWISNDASVNLTDVSNIISGLTGLVISGNTKHEVEKCVNYVTCHDNYTLYDRFVAAGIEDEAVIKKMAMLANSVVFTSQGVTFMLAGEEFLRTKGGNSNSYNASYEVNELDYSLKVKHLDMFKNYQKLIALKQNKALFGKTGIEAEEIIVNTNFDGSLIYFDLEDQVNNRTYRIIHSNGVSNNEKVIDMSGYTLYLDTLGLESLVLNQNTTIADYQTIIAYKNN